MLHGGVILLTSFAYLGILFAIAYYGDKRADAGRSIIATPYIYALSLAVYATSWTFYGSVGRAAASGVGFLPIYLGPTLMAALWWLVLRKMIRISKAHRITSIADFVAARYGKSGLLGGLVTVIAVVGIIPYIALQLKAVSASFLILLRHPEIVMPARGQPVHIVQDTALYVALLLAAFTIVFGTRHLDATERHEGMVAAIAFESLVKLLAFLAVGLFVTFGLYNGFGDVFARAAELPRIDELLTLGGSAGTYGSWASLVLLSMLSILFLPRQFQISVVENVNEDHVSKAIWLFPAYLFAINIFVLPIAFAGLMLFPAGEVDADTFVLTLPMAHGQEALALFVFIGGLSAATGMVIVETIALSTMICNDLVMPALLRWRARAMAARSDLSGLLLAIRRGAIVLLMVLGYAYYRIAGEAYALVSIGLVSFAAVAQFAPAMLGGMYWKQGTRCCCRPSPSRVGCPCPSSRTARWASHGSSRWRCSAWTAWTTSATPCSGACSPTWAAMPASRSWGSPTCASRRRQFCSWTCSATSSAARGTGAAPGRCRTCCAWWDVSSARRVPARPSPNTPSGEGSGASRR